MRVAGRFARAAALAAALSVAVGGPLEARQKADLGELLPRIGEYIRTFVAGFSNVVAEESYKQEITSPHRKRALKSDVMLVKYPGADGWLVFRDTFEVDGKSVRTEPERLSKLFLEPPDNALRRAREITGASAKYNIVNIGNLNNPMLVLALMQEENHERFRFTTGGIEKSLGPDVRVLQFKEYRTPTLMKMDGSQDVFTAGIVYVEQATGRIVKTQFNLGRRGSGIEIQTTFHRDPGLGIDVPVLMKEWYPDGMGGDVRGEASYGGFRRFTVTTSEGVK
jgi:hypothetical protein